MQNFKTKNASKVSKKNKHLKETFRNLILSIELYHKMYIDITYAPGGPGFKEAQKDFEELVGLEEYTFTNNT